MKQVFFEELVDLSKLCTIKIGGKARKVFFPKTKEDVSILLKEASETGKKFIPIGIGSNTVFSDGLLEHIFVSTRNLKKYSISFTESSALIHAEAGVSFKTLENISKKYNLSGFESLSGIPASVGGATVMNAGAYGTEFGDIIQKVHWIDPEGNVMVMERSDINFGYRYSPFQKNGFIFAVEIELKKTTKNIKEIIKKHLYERARKQPLDMPTSGSTFKNPPEKPAGYLLEMAGMKGHRIGNVAFSQKHANFLVNLGGGKYKELKELIYTAERRVGELYHIRLEKEIKIVE